MITTDATILRKLNRKQKETISNILVSLKSLKLRKWHGRRYIHLG